MSDIIAPAASRAARAPGPARWPTAWLARPWSARPWSARRILQACLALIWLLDAALQFQPYMFTSKFVSEIIEPTAAGNPAVIAGPITWSAHLMAQHIVAANAAFAVIQLAIAAGLFFDRTTKLALAASVAWAASVWWFGEGMGGVLTRASPLAGLPGAVLLYALIALLVWPGRDDSGAAVAAPALRGPLGPVTPKLAWLALWCGFGWYLLAPGNRAPDAMSQIFAGQAASQAGWVAAIERTLAGLTAGHGLAISILLAALCALTGLAVYTGRLTRTALILACLLGLLFWTAEGFGGITTGQATDPNSGPLLILLAACFWPPASAARPGARPWRTGA
jgi:hypothetical protein